VQEKEAARQVEGVADDEGWIKVTRLSKNKATTTAATRSTESQDKRAKRKLKKRNREKVSSISNPLLRFSNAFTAFALNNYQ